MNRSFRWIILSCFVVLLCLISLALGSVYIPLDDIVSILFGSTELPQTWGKIVFDLRIPRVITTILVGAGLSICGLQMQTLFRNPLAGPFVLGISSGASLGVALLVLAGGIFTLTWVTGHWTQALAASAGAMLVLFLTLLIALRIRDVMSLLIIGLMLGSLTSAVVAILQFFSTGEEIQVYLLWTFGSLGGLDWVQISILGVFAAVGLFLSISSIKALNAFLLGERYAESVGTNVPALRIRILLSTGLLAGVITAFCGPIAFIGLAVPHFSRLYFRTSDHRILLPGCLLIGIITMLFCDLIARLPGSQFVLPINAVSSLIGAPVVIWLVIKRGKISKSFT